MGSSAQNSSGVHWCRSRVRFNEVPEKVPKVLEKVWEVLVQSQVMFNRVLEKVPKKVPEKVWEASVQQGQVQQGSGEGSGEGLGGFGESQVGLTGFAAFQFTETKLRCIERCFAARFRKICQNATFRLLGIPPKPIVYMGNITSNHGIFCLKFGS